MVAESQAKYQQVQVLLHINAVLRARERVLRRAVEGGDLKLLEVERGLSAHLGAAAGGCTQSAAIQMGPPFVGQAQLGSSVPLAIAATTTVAGIYPQPAGISLAHAAAAAALPAAVTSPQCLSMAAAAAVAAPANTQAISLPGQPASSTSTQTADGDAQSPTMAGAAGSGTECASAPSAKCASMPSVKFEAATQPVGLGASAAAHAAAMPAVKVEPAASPQLPDDASAAPPSQPQELGWELPPATGDAELEWMLGRLRELPPAEEVPLDVLQCISRRGKEVVIAYHVSMGQWTCWVQGD